MKTSESIIKIAKAMKEFQAVAINAFKEKAGYNYKYAPLDVILKENRPLMAQYGLSHIQSEHYADNIVTVETRIMHESGEWIETTAQSPYASLKGMNDYQSIGSGITYLRRYGLSSALGIAADEDADARGEQMPSTSKANAEDMKRLFEAFKNKCSLYGVDNREFVAHKFGEHLMDNKKELYKNLRLYMQQEKHLEADLEAFAGIEKPAYSA